MNIWLTRHGQTDLNKARIMQGLIDAPLNETGLAQAAAAREKLIALHPGLTFDAVYASPLQRAIATASIIGGADRSEVITDERIIEVDFGKYEGHKYHLLGPRMTLYWVCPEIFPTPPTVETTASMIERSHSFLKELEQKDYKNVLITCHGGIIRALSGYLEDMPRGYKWRPRPHNCEVRVYEAAGGKHRFIEQV